MADARALYQEIEKLVKNMLSDLNEGDEVDITHDSDEHAVSVGNLKMLAFLALDIGSRYPNANDLTSEVHKMLISGPKGQ